MAPLSDYNKAGYKAKTVAAEADQIFSDLNLSLPIHPNKNDITPLTDIDAIKQAVKNIVLTNFGEKLFRPQFGSRVAGRLFEGGGPFVALAIRDDIKYALRDFEKRVEIIDVIVNDRSDSNEFIVTLQFRIAHQPNISEVEFALNRLR